MKSKDDMDIDAMEKALPAAQQEQPPDYEEMDDEQKSKYKQWLEEQLDWLRQGKGKGGKGGKGGRDGSGKGGKDMICNDCQQNMAFSKILQEARLG